MNIVSKTFTYSLPNEFLVDHAFSQGKTREYTYWGPEKLYLQISNETQEETHGPLTEEDRADGRPIPADCYLFEINVNDYPLIMQLRAPIVNEKQEERHTGEVFHPQSPEIEGYRRFSYTTPLMPDDIFNKHSIKIVNNIPSIQPFSVNFKLLGNENDINWDNIRDQRNSMLEGSDAQVAEDMPQAVKDTFILYRQRLRDLPAVMQAHNVPPVIARQMFPDHPHATRLPNPDKTPR